ncbi:MAG TPA: HIT domain-containing protein [Nitrospiria bacterium]
MDRIWAPWRMPYLKNPKKEKGCIFCLKPRRKNDAENLILYRGKRAFVLMNLYPYSNGHLMVSPYRHVGDLEKLDPPTLREIMTTVQKAMSALRRSFKPNAFNVGVNQGREAGAGIADHIHFHIVPRWNGDTNFMPVLGATRVIPEDLETTYERLRPLFKTGKKRLKKMATAPKKRSRGK